MKMGIDKYNNECRKIVSRYSAEWENIVGRLGRWIDFKHDYKSMYPWFMESIWWVFKQLFEKGFVYKGFKVILKYKILDLATMYWKPGFVFIISLRLFNYYDFV